MSLANLSQSDAEKILKANVANVVKKVQAGKTLSAAERDLVEKSAKGKGRVFENFEQAVAALGKYDVKRLKLAKNLGCPAFKQGNRIHENELLPWMAAHADELIVKGDNVALRDQKTNEEIRKLKIANDLKEGKLITRELVIAAHHKFERSFRELINQKLVNEFPAMVSGLDIPGARVYGRNLCDNLVSKMRELVEQFEI